MPATKSCSFEGCNKVARARGLCRSHYLQQRRGAPLTPLQKQRKAGLTRDGLIAHLAEQSTSHDGPLDTPCRLWQGYCHPQGYGMIGFEGRLWRVHRLAYVLQVGPIPDGLFVCHRCDTPLCIEPGHLYVGTHADNMKDRAKRNRAHRPVGESHNMAKLTWDAVREIRRRYAAGGETLQSLADEFGVAFTNISMIVRGVTWKEPADQT